MAVAATEEAVEPFRAAQWVALAAALAAVLLTALNIWQHARHLMRPRLQGYAIRILCMVPVYATASTLAMFVPEGATIAFTIRDIYEAYVLFQFTAMLVAYVGGEEAMVVLIGNRWEEEDGRAETAAAHAGLDWFAARYPADRASSRDALLSWRAVSGAGGKGAAAYRPRSRWDRFLDAVLGCSLCRPAARGDNAWRAWWPSPAAHFRTVKWCILQYSLVMPVLGLVVTVLASLELARRGDFSAQNAFLWLTAVQALSAVLSILALLHFYWLVRHAMPEFSPGAKFACVKAVIFLSYIQLIALELVDFVGTRAVERVGRPACWGRADVAAPLAPASPGPGPVPNSAGRAPGAGRVHPGRAHLAGARGAGGGPPVGLWLEGLCAPGAGRAA